MPVLNIWATPSERMRPFSEAAQASARENIQNLTSVHVPGHHHWHMEAETAAQIARQIEKFLVRT